MNIEESFLRGFGDEMRKIAAPQALVALGARALPAVAEAAKKVAPTAAVNLAPALIPGNTVPRTRAKVDLGLSGA